MVGLRRAFGEKPRSGKRSRLQGGVDYIVRTWGAACCAPTRTDAWWCASGLFGAEGVDWVDRRGAARGDVACEHGGGGQAGGDGDVGERVHRADAEEDGGHEAHEDEGGDEAAGYPDAGEDQAVADEHVGEDS